MPMIEALDLRALVDRPPHVAASTTVAAWDGRPLEEIGSGGFHLDRARFDADLRHLANESGAALVAARVFGFELDSHAWTIATSSGDDISARFIVDATGRNAFVATRLGAIRRYDDSTTALVTSIARFGADSDLRTIIEATCDGWLVTTPLPNRRRLVAFHGPSDVVARMKKSPVDLRVCVRTSKHVSNVIHPRAELDHFVMREACGARLDRFVGHRWLATGDAALSFDPLVADGISAAIDMGARAAHAIDKTMHDDADAFAHYVDHVEKLRADYLERRHALARPFRAA